MAEQKPTSHRQQPSSRTELVISNGTIVRILLIITLFAATIAIIFGLGSQLIWVAIAFFLALAITPAVDWVARYIPGKSRGLSLTIVLVSIIAVISYMISALVPPLIDQLTSLVRNFPDYWNNLVSSNNFIGNSLRNWNVTDQLVKNQGQIINSLSNVSAWLSGAATGLIALITIFTLTFFMVLEGPRWLNTFWSYQDPKRRKARQILAAKMYKSVSGFVIGNILTSVIATIATTILLVILGVPSPLALGILVGIFDLIPLVGATLAAIVVTIFVLAYGGPTAGLISITYFILYQQLENNILQPIVFSKSISISPLVVGIAALFGATLAGFFGALVAVPVAASLQILVKDLLSRRQEIIDKT